MWLIWAGVFQRGKKASFFFVVAVDQSSSAKKNRINCVLWCPVQSDQSVSQSVSLRLSVCLFFHARTHAHINALSLVPQTTMASATGGVMRRRRRWWSSSSALLLAWTAAALLGQGADAAGRAPDACTWSWFRFSPLLS